MLIISALLEGWWRKGTWLLAIIFSLSYVGYLVFYPSWVDAEIEKKVTLIQPYLQDRYPDEEWTISTVPHREDGYKHMNPFHIFVTFHNEPDVTYSYQVKDSVNIYQNGFSTNKSPNSLRHDE